MPPPSAHEWSTGLGPRKLEIDLTRPIDALLDRTDQGDIVAMLSLAKRFEWGTGGVPFNERQAMALYCTVATNLAQTVLTAYDRSLRDSFDYAATAFDSPHAYTQYLRRALAALLDGVDLTAYGTMLLSAFDVGGWMRPLAEAGHVSGMAVLGLTLVERAHDDAEGADWLRRAAREGAVVAMIKLRMENILYQTVNPTEYYEWLRVAAYSGSASATQLFTQNLLAQPTMAPLVREDLRTLLTQRAEAGQTYAMVALCSLALSDKGKEATAAGWARRAYAANPTSPLIMFMHATFLLRGYGTGSAEHAVRDGVALLVTLNRIGFSPAAEQLRVPYISRLAEEERARRPTMSSTDPRAVYSPAGTADPRPPYPPPSLPLVDLRLPTRPGDDPNTLRLGTLRCDCRAPHATHNTPLE
jgi:TPR repeat protein